MFVLLLLGAGTSAATPASPEDAGSGNSAPAAWRSAADTLFLQPLTALRDLAGASGAAVQSGLSAIGSYVDELAAGGMPPRTAVPATAPPPPAPAAPEPVAAESESAPRPAAPPPAAAPPAVVMPAVPMPGECAHPRMDGGHAEPERPTEAGLSAAVGSTPLDYLLEGARRRPDGTLFVPKPVQHLLAVRTTVACVDVVAERVSVVGRIIPDPNGGGLVQAAETGRVVADDAGLPHIGMKVTRGQVLAYLEPALGAMQRSELRDEFLTLSIQIKAAERRVQRLREFPFVPWRDYKVSVAEIELDGLRRRREAVEASMIGRVPLRATASGVISVVRVRVGQVIEARDVLFEIVDPQRLWVEATVFDQSMGHGIVSAAAVTGDGAALPLTFIGAGLAQRQQAIPLTFKLAQTTADLTIGRPVRVIIQHGARTRGIVVPRDSVVHTPAGQAIVWEHGEAEEFQPRPVRVEPIDGKVMLVLDGVVPDQRIVTRGAGLLNQIR